MAQFLQGDEVLRKNQMAAMTERHCSISTVSGICCSIIEKSNGPERGNAGPCGWFFQTKFGRKIPAAFSLMPAMRGFSLTPQSDGGRTARIPAGTRFSDDRGLVSGHQDRTYPVVRDRSVPNARSCIGRSTHWATGRLVAHPLFRGVVLGVVSKSFFQ